MLPFDNISYFCSDLVNTRSNAINMDEMIIDMNNFLKEITLQSQIEWIKPKVSYYIKLVEQIQKLKVKLPNQVYAQ